MCVTAPALTRRADLAPESDPDLGQLKRLLLVDERRHLDALQRSVSALDRRLGTDDRFCRAVADSLVVALKVAEIEQHRDLAGVMAPIVVAGIRREIAESKEVMVEALYPLMGRLVTTAVAHALRQLAEDLNRRLESKLSPRLLKLRLRALLTRRPFAELVLAAAAEDRVERLLLLDRASGAVLATSVLRDGRVAAEEASSDALNLLGGLMAAIIEFADHALSEVNGELRTLDFGGQSVLLRVSPLYVVAAISSGPTSARLQQAVDDSFLTFLERDHAVAASALAALHEVLHAAPPQPRGRSLGYLGIVALIIALGLGWAGSEAWLRGRQHGAQAAMLASIARSPELLGYPLDLVLDRGRSTLTASGLAPTPEAWAGVRRRLEEGFPGFRVEERLAIVSETPQARETRASLREAEARADALHARLTDLSAKVEGLAPAMAGLETAQRNGEAALRSGLAETADQIGRVEQETAAALAAHPLRSEVAEIRRETAELAGRLDAPDRRLVETAARTAVFFGEDAAYRDPERAAATLEVLALALRADGVARLRIVGYGDSLGGIKANQRVARLRAERVAADLMRLGVEPSRLRTVTTPFPVPISDDVGPTSANRRVTFGLAYADE